MAKTYKQMAALVATTYNKIKLMGSVSAEDMAAAREAAKRLRSRAGRPRRCLPKAGRLPRPEAGGDSPERHVHPRRHRRVA